MSFEIVPQNDSRRTNWLVVGLVLLGVVVSLLPIVLHLSAPSNRGAGPVFAYLPAILAAVLCYALDPALAKREKATALYLCLVLSFLTTYLHVWMVDIGPFHGGPNLWQLAMHQAVIDLSPDRLPHSYRFLPNSLVRLFEQVTGDFAVARDSYRNLFGILMFYAFYRFARSFLRQRGSLLCLTLFAAILPVSFRYYAGQLTDPMSHLSFILAFIFIETEQFVYLVLTLTIGCLAKETILAMAGYYVLFRWQEKSYLGKSAILVLASIAVYEIARISVLHGFPNYHQISGVGFEHVAENWKAYADWLPGLFYTCGIFVPFVAVGWTTSPWLLRSLAIFLFPVLFISSLFFGWLWEARNFVPLAAVLIILTVHKLQSQTAVVDGRA